MAHKRPYLPSGYTPEGYPVKQSEEFDRLDRRALVKEELKGKYDVLDGGAFITRYSNRKEAEKHVRNINRAKEPWHHTVKRKKKRVSNTIKKLRAEIKTLKAKLRKKAKHKRSR